MDLFIIYNNGYNKKNNVIILLLFIYYYNHCFYIIIIGYWPSSTITVLHWNMRWMKKKKVTKKRSPRPCFYYY